MNRRRATPFLLLLLSLAAPAAAQDALVLSGGGSRGLAHAGAAVALERLGYDPGIVVGTSMGAIVGALYAAGYAPEDIWSLVEARDWRELFAPQPLLLGPQRRLRSPVLRFELDGGEASLLQGFVPDWRINRLLTRLLFLPGARALGDFDRLPRRYRAVGASLRTGEAIALGRGDLAKAVRASMAVPGVFAPIGWGDEILVDGGISNYLPTSVARDMGADHVIAVDVLRPPDSIQSTDPLAVATRSLRLSFLQARTQDARPDVLVLPALDPSLSPAVFPISAGPLLRAGLEATLGAVPRAEDAAERGARAAAALPASLSELVVDAPGPAMEAVTRRAFEYVAPGPFDADAVLSAVDRLYATGHFDAVWVSVEPRDEQAAPALRVETSARPAPLLSGAAAYHTDRGASAWAALRQRMRLAEWPVTYGIEGGVGRFEWWAAAQAAAALPSALPLGWSIGLAYTDSDVPFAGLAGEEVDVTRAGGWASLDLSALEPDVSASLALIAEAVAVGGASDRASVGPRLAVERVPPLVQRVGVPAAFEAEARWGDVAYQRIAARGSLPLRLGSFAAAVVADGALASAATPPDARPALGGSGGIPGYDWGQEPGRRRLIGGLDLAYPAPLEGVLRLRARAGAIFRGGGSEEIAAGARLSALWWTPLGAVEAGLETSAGGGLRFVAGVGPSVEFP